MSVKNLVQCPLITPVSSTATELLLGAVSAPYSLPPLDGGILVIADSVGKPSFVEFIKYTHRIDNVLYGVSRGQEETAARNWAGVTYVYQALTADQYTSELASKEPVIPPGTAAQYWRGDKSFQDLATAIRAANLTGFSTATNSAVVSTDTLLAALGKLQAQMNVRLLSTANAVSATKLQTARTINGVPFDGTAAIVVEDSTKLPLTGGVLTGSLDAGVNSVLGNLKHTCGYFELRPYSATYDDGSLVRLYWDGNARKVKFSQGGTGSGVVALTGVAVNGNADTATKLETARTINGVAFDGTANITVADSTKEPAFAAGTTAQYRRGDKTWQDFATAVRASVMTGLSTVTNAAVVATDTLLAAVGKLQAQITGLESSKLDATANAVSASKLATARSIALAGDVTGSATFDGSANVSITATVADDSHNHIIANVDGLQTTLDSKLPLTGGTLTGVLSGTRVVMAGGGNSYSSVGVESRGNGVTNTVFPGVGFHQPGAYAGSLQLRADKDFRLYSGDDATYANLTALQFNGSAAGLTAIPAAQLTGTVPDAVLPASITSSITGNAATATKLATARTINGVAFDGSANITLDASDVTKLPLAGGTMTGHLTMGDSVSVRLGAGADCVMYHSGTHTYIDQNVTGNLYIRNNVTGGTILFYADNSGGTSQLVAQFGVGTDNAAYLYAGGSTKLNTTAAGVSVTGTLTASSNITAYSDARLKEDVQVIPDALNKVVQLRGVTFKRKDTGERQVGVIAQEVQKVLPEAVIQGEEYLSVAYGNMVGLLIESIKELNDKVDSLQEEVTELRRVA